MRLFFCLVWPVPLHITQGVMMIEPRPPQRRHVERIINGPVFTDSYTHTVIWHDKNNTYLLTLKSPWRRLLRCSHHAGAVAVVTLCDFGARLVTFTMATWTVILDVHCDLLVHSFGCLGERQLHDILHTHTHHLENYITYTLKQ